MASWFTTKNPAFTPIVFPSLGRRVQVGHSVYNYAEDVVTLLPDLKVKPVPELGPLSINNSLEVELEFSTSENLNDFKWKQLQLNSHLRCSILTGLLPGPFWFSEFLDVYSEAESAVAGKILAKIAVHVYARISQENKITDISLRAIKREIGLRKDCKNISHVVSGLVFGFNGILTFEIEVSNLTEKENVEACLYLEAKRVFSELTPSTKYYDQSERQVVWLKKAKFNFYSDRQFSSGSYEDILSQLKNAVKGDNLRNNVPMEMTLSPINDSIQTRDLDSDTFTALLHMSAKKSAINKQYHLLMTDPLLMEIPHLKFRVEKFKQLAVNEHFKRTSQILLSAVKSFRKDNQTQSELMMIIEIRRLAMENLLQWFMARQQELSVLKTLLKDIKIPWTTDLEQFNQVKFQENVQVFLFKIKENIEALSDGKQLKSTVYDILTVDDSECQKFRNNLLKFSAKTQKKKDLLYLSTSMNCHTLGTVLKINNHQETSKDKSLIIENICRKICFLSPFIVPFKTSLQFFHVSFI